MRYFLLYICLQASSLVQALPTLSQAADPNAILAAGTQSLSSPSNVPSPTGTIQTSLETSGRSSIQPFPTTVISIATFTSANAASTSVASKAPPKPDVSLSDIFNAPISSGGPVSIIPSRPDHPVPRTGITNQKGPIGTNKFYANFFLGNQTNAVWTQPYSMLWSQGTGNAKSWGLSVSHDDPDQRAFGPDASKNPIEYFINPIGIQSIVLSAAELGPSMSLTTDSLTAFSANVNLLANNGASPAITLPLVQGMGFVTAIYNGVTPFIDSSIFFRTISPLPSPKTGVTKYKLSLEDGKTWLLYATAANGTGLALTSTSSSRLSAAGPFTGTIQVAKNPGDVATQEASYDSAAGSYPTSASISGSVDGVSGSYTLSWTKAGNGSPLIMNALPHHIQSMDATTSAGKTDIQLQSTTHGTMTGVIGDSWTMVEPDIPANMTFAPWIAADGSTAAIPASAVAQINAAGTSELAQDMNAQSNLNSMYYSGKALSKFATAIYAIHDLTGDTALASSGLDKLKTAYAVFANNKQQYPLVYESAWGGVVSSAAYVTGNAGEDFGNSYYNDHHFHWSYFVHAAAIIGYLDPTWIPANKDWVNTLVRDAGNPVADDQYFPFSRSFDWFHGHSWAKGLFDSADGKDQESSSEDALFAYAMKMWGKTSGDANMEARGNLMLAVMKRSLSNYFLLESVNTNQPANFIGNKVTGILFENKVDHVTYFGANPEYIQGIHMLPIVPSSAYLRNQNFVAEEWKTYFDNGRVDQVAGGWRGVLYSNLALIDAKASYDWFSGSSFDPQYLDGGASLTWSLAMAVGLGGAN